jgi:4'-phosphopantetheinyl transferase
MRKSIIIYSAFFDRELSPGKFIFYMDKLPEREKEKIVKFRKWEDATASLIGKALLQEIFINVGFDTIRLADIKYTEFNKPFLEHGLHFNIAHSGNYVVCGVSQSGEIGIDIEQIKTMDMKYYLSILSPRELESLNSATRPEDVFYNIWTKKEAIVKADGRGLGVPLNEIDTLDNPVWINNNFWYTEKLAIHPDYAGHIAYKDNQASIKHTHIEI